MCQKLRNRWAALRQKILSTRVGSEGSTEGNLSGGERQALIKLDEDYRYIPPQNETGRILTQLSQAEIDILFLYTGSEHDTYTYEGQLRAMFPALSKNNHLSEKYLQEADHTLVLKEDREKVLQLIGEWFRQSSFSRS